MMYEYGDWIDFSPWDRGKRITDRHPRTVRVVCGMHTN